MGAHNRSVSVNCLNHGSFGIVSAIDRMLLLNNRLRL